MHTHTFTQTYVHISMPTQTCTTVCAHTYKYTCVHAVTSHVQTLRHMNAGVQCTHTCTLLHTYKCSCTRSHHTHMQTLRHMCMQTCTLTCAYTLTCACTDTDTDWHRPSPPGPPPSSLPQVGTCNLGADPHAVYMCVQGLSHMHSPTLQETEVHTPPAGTQEVDGRAGPTSSFSPKT